MWTVYIVRCGDTTLYTGITTDITRRLRQHNGEVGMGAAYTKTRRPVTLVYVEPAKTRSSAQKREAEIKKMRKQNKKMLIMNQTTSQT